MIVLMSISLKNKFIYFLPKKRREISRVMASRSSIMVQQRDESSKEDLYFPNEDKSNFAITSLDELH